MMVRDEADVIAATIEHHLAEGIDRILVTDNASVDGTREILAEYARIAPVTVFDDPEHRKQQAEVVTRMARQAATEHGADWVINGDADEFVLAREGTVAEALAAAPTAIGAFPAPVHNLVGPTARRGSGLATRMHWRDERSPEQLAAAGVQAQPTPNAIHVADPSVEVAQGNHFVSTPQRFAAEGAFGLEVLHVPWRSWEQFERKTVKHGARLRGVAIARPEPQPPRDARLAALEGRHPAAVLPRPHTRRRRRLRRGVRARRPARRAARGPRRAPARAAGRGDRPGARRTLRPRRGAGDARARARPARARRGVPHRDRRRDRAAPGARAPCHHPERLARGVRRVGREIARRIRR